MPSILPAQKIFQDPQQLSEYNSDYSVPHVGERFPMAAKKRGPKKAKIAAPKKAKKAKSPTPRVRSAQPHSGQSGPPMDLQKFKLNEKESRVVSVLIGEVTPLPLNALAAASFPTSTTSQANSWVRNSLRRLVRGAWVEKVGKGTYTLTATGKAKWDQVDTAPIQSAVATA